MASRAEKKCALLKFRHDLLHVSSSALAAFLDEARQGRLPDLDTKSIRDDLRSARDAFVSEKTPYGPAHRDVEVPGLGAVEVQVPAAMMWQLRNHPGWNELLEGAKDIGCRLAESVFSRGLSSHPSELRFIRTAAVASRVSLVVWLLPSRNIDSHMFVLDRP